MNQFKLQGQKFMCGDSAFVVPVSVAKIRLDSAGWGKGTFTDPIVGPFTVKIKVRDKGKASGDFYMNGLSGRPEQDGQCYPFALVADGSIDFGASSENEEDRWWKTDVREKKIEVGAAFKVTEKETDYDYAIVKSQSLFEIP